MQTVNEFLARTPVRRLFVPAWYPAKLPGTPNLLVLRRSFEVDQPIADGVDEVFAARVVPLFIEDVAERKFVERMLDQPMPLVDGRIALEESFAAVNLRCSNLPASARRRLLHYRPSRSGWPHFLVAMAAVPSAQPGTARNRYQINVFQTALEVERRIAWLSVEFGQATAALH